MVTDLPELIERLKGLSTYDRYLDLEIAVAVDFEGVFSRFYDWKWGAGGDEIEGHSGGKRCAFLDPVQFVPHWTGSLDAAVKLVPEGWFWRVGRTSLFPGWANVHATHPDHGQPGENEFHFHSESYHNPAAPPVVCLVICALQAYAAIVKKQKRGAACTTF